MPIIQNLAKNFYLSVCPNTTWYLLKEPCAIHPTSDLSGHHVLWVALFFLRHGFSMEPSQALNSRSSCQRQIYRYSQPHLGLLASGCKNSSFKEQKATQEIKVTGAGPRGRSHPLGLLLRTSRHLYTQKPAGQSQAPARWKQEFFPFT